MRLSDRAGAFAPRGEQHPAPIYGRSGTSPVMPGRLLLATIAECDWRATRPEQEAARERAADKGV